MEVIKCFPRLPVNNQFFLLHILSIFFFYFPYLIFLFSHCSPRFFLFSPHALPIGVAFWWPNSTKWRSNHAYLIWVVVIDQTKLETSFIEIFYLHFFCLFICFSLIDCWYVLWWLCCWGIEFWWCNRLERCYFGHRITIQKGTIWHDMIKFTLINTYGG